MVVVQQQLTRVAKVNLALRATEIAAVAYAHIPIRYI